MKIAITSKLIAGITAIIMGIMIIAFGQYAYGAVCLICGIVIFTIALMQKKTNKENEKSQEGQKIFVQNIDSVAEISNPITVTVKINDSLKKGKFSIFLNGVKVGNIRFGEVLQFNTQKAINLVKVGKLDGKPFNWAESGYSFDASQTEGTVNLEITHKNLLIMIKNITNE